MEGYLAHKWGISEKLVTGHTFSSRFSADSPTGNGKSFDLSNGTFASISTGGTEDVFDGDSNFSISMWVKGWPSATGESLVTKNDFHPSTYGKLQAWLDASEPAYLSTDLSTSPPLTMIISPNGLTGLEMVIPPKSLPVPQSGIVPDSIQSHP